MKGIRWKIPNKEKEKRTIKSFAWKPLYCDVEEEYFWLTTYWNWQEKICGKWVTVYRNSNAPS